MSSARHQNACDSPLLPSDTFVLTKEDDVNIVDRMKRTTYQQVLGSLNWFNTATRPDLAVVCSLAGWVASNPTHKQFSALCRAVGYLKRKLNIPLTYNGTECNGVVRLAGFSDSDWAGQKLSLNSKDAEENPQLGIYLFFLRPYQLEKQTARNPSYEFSASRVYGNV